MALPPSFISQNKLHHRHIRYWNDDTYLLYGNSCMCMCIRACTWMCIRPSALNSQSDDNRNMFLNINNLINHDCFSLSFKHTHTHTLHHTYIHNSVTIARGQHESRNTVQMSIFANRLQVIDFSTVNFTTLPLFYSLNRIFTSSYNFRKQVTKSWHACVSVVCMCNNCHIITIFTDHPYAILIIHTPKSFYKILNTYLLQRVHNLNGLKGKAEKN